MITYSCIELGIAYLLGIMVPGPSIVLVIKNGMLYSRSASITTCLGVILGIALQSGAVLLSFTMVDNNPIFLKVIKILCSTYLIYLGLRVFLSKNVEESESDCVTSITNNKQYINFFLEGFLIECLNPLALTFFVSIITIIINPQELLNIKIIYWLEIIILGFIWFFTVAYIISGKKITFFTRKFNRILDRIAGCVFILLGSQIFILH